MKCPYCGYLDDKVIDSRVAAEGESIRRRRACGRCERRYTTYERVELAPLRVVKKDGRREPFDRQKILAGVLKACEKRPVSVERVEALVDGIEQRLQRDVEGEVASGQIGELVVDALRGIDQVAYVRFASVYRQFKDIQQFMEEVRETLNRQRVPR